MRAGNLRHRLQIQTASETRGTQGSVSRTWQTDETVWGSIEPLSGRELLAAQQVDSEITHRVIVRGYPGLTSASRLKHGARILKIKSILNKEERGEEMELLCGEDV